MPRTKGSKNKSKLTTGYASQIAEKQEAIASLTSEITSITANIDTLKVDLKEKKAALKTIQKELTRLSPIRKLRKKQRKPRPKRC